MQVSHSKRSNKYALPDWDFVFLVEHSIAPKASVLQLIYLLSDRFRAHTAEVLCSYGGGSRRNHV